VSVGHDRQNARQKQTTREDFDIHAQALRHYTRALPYPRSTEGGTPKGNQNSKRIAKKRVGTYFTFGSGRENFFVSNNLAHAFEQNTCAARPRGAHKPHTHLSDTMA
jgi:hypothetical protein